MGLNLQHERRLSELMRVTVAEPQVRGREAQDERSGRQNHDHRNTNRQRGRVRAASVLANTKPKAHQDASSRAGWPVGKVQVLTRGDLDAERRRGVSRGRSSDEARRKAGGAKGRSTSSMVELEALWKRQENPGTRGVATAAATADRHERSEPVRPGRDVLGGFESHHGSQSHRKP